MAVRALKSVLIDMSRNEERDSNSAHLPPIHWENIAISGMEEFSDCDRAHFSVRGGFKYGNQAFVSVKPGEEMPIIDFRAHFYFAGFDTTLVSIGGGRRISWSGTFRPLEKERESGRVFDLLKVIESNSIEIIAEKGCLVKIRVESDA